MHTAEYFGVIRRTATHIGALSRAREAHALSSCTLADLVPLSPVLNKSERARDRRLPVYEFVSFKHAGRCASQSRPPPTPS